MARLSKTTPHATPERLRASAGAAPGFTLMELIVSIAAVAVISVGLAALFRSVGKTVTGGKRVSLLTTYAGLIESRMRRDFEAMSRDGFLVIRQQWVQPNPGPVVGPADRIPTGEDDLRPRLRRSDEIVFFTTGKFESSRTPLNPSVQALGDAARVYYGHGQAARDLDPTNPNSVYYTPEINDPNADVGARLGELNPAGVANPNAYAGSWTIVRQETLLSKPQASQGPIPTLAGVAAPARRANNDAQVALQPAAPTIFRSLNQLGPIPVPAGAVRPFFPQFSSGLVDTATTDLGEIQMWVTSCSMTPDLLTLPYDGLLGGQIPPTPNAPVSVRPPSNAAESVDRMHAWMEQAFPTQSAAALAVAGIYPIPGETPGMRVRYEHSPTDYFRAVASTGDPGGFQTALEGAYRRADQMMLTAQNFLPHCSEFIIEWSFGNQNAAGETVWQGPTRWTDLDNDGVFDGNEPLVALPYVTGSYNIYYPRVGANPGQHQVSQRLIYGFDVVPEASVHTCYFGYFDPTFPAPADANGDGAPDSGEPAVGTLPWAWPRLIRVTVTLSDAQEPTIENTFQFIFTTPEQSGL